MKPFVTETFTVLVACLCLLLVVGSCSAGDLGGTHRLEAQGALTSSVVYFMPPAWSIGGSEAAGTRGADPDEAGDIQTRVEKFVRGKYVHGVPYFRARELGAEAIPILQAMLRDTSEVEWWSTIVMTMGSIGDSSSVDTLIDFLENRFEGEVTSPQFRALLTVGTALGVIAANGSLSALEYLSDACYVKTWLAKGPKWHFRNYSGESLAILLAKVAVSGLGYSGTDRAKEILIELQEHPESEKSAVRLKSNIKEGLERIDRIQKEGIEKFLGRREQ